MSGGDRRVNGNGWEVIIDDRNGGAIGSDAVRRIGRQRHDDRLIRLDVEVLNGSDR